MRDGFIKVAAGTPKIRVADCRFNAEQVFTLMREAARQGVRVLALPELCLTGYTCADLFLQDTCCGVRRRGWPPFWRPPKTWIWSQPWACRCGTRASSITAPR